MNMDIKPKEEMDGREFTTSFFPFNNIYMDPNSSTLADLGGLLSMGNEEPSGFGYYEEPAPVSYTPLEDASAFHTGGVPDQHHNPAECNDPVSGVHIYVVEQPPVEVRTRTANEKRAFSCAVQVSGDYKSLAASHVGVDLGYAVGGGGRPSQTILGGNKLGRIGDDGVVRFELSMSEASTKHKGNDFVLEFYLVTPDGRRLATTSAGGGPMWVSQPFYAYSNQKVLARRRNITLRAISKVRGTTKGGETMHVIGSPFISSPSLQVRISTAHGELMVSGSGIELYSESVLFFTLPPYPMPIPSNLPDGFELRAQVRVSNDGRYFSNPLDFTYVSENNKRLRSRF